MNMADKTADLAGPGISTYEEVEKILPTDYEPLLNPRERMQALYAVKSYIEDKPVQGAQPGHGSGPPDRRPGEWRQRLPRP
jgi:hypothetical protein